MRDAREEGDEERDGLGIEDGLRVVHCALQHIGPFVCRFVDFFCWSLFLPYSLFARASNNSTALPFEHPDGAANGSVCLST